MFKSKPTASNGRCWLPCAVQKTRETDPGVAVGPVTAVDQSLAARSERGARNCPGWNLPWLGWKSHVRP